MKWRCFMEDLPVFFLMLLLQLVDRSSQDHRSRDRWEHISIRYGIWSHLPPYQPQAFREGYERVNNVCKTDYYHGFLFIRDGNHKAMPIYDLDGNLAGVQSAIPGNMRGYNMLNQTIDLPPVEIMPPVLKGNRDKNGILYYTVTAYFKHPKLICSPIASKDVSPGRGLYIQMGYKPTNDFLKIPIESKHLDPMLWRSDNCIPMMGTHYFKNMSQNLPCEKLHPLFLMYDMEGKLGAFGWVFQGRPHDFYSEDGMGWFHLEPNTYPFLYDTSRLPPCMLYEKFQVFGIHIYLRNATKMLCTPHKQTNKETTTVGGPPSYQQQDPTERPFITSLNGYKPNQESINAFNNNSTAVGLHNLRSPMSQVLIFLYALVITDSLCH